MNNMTLEHVLLSLIVLMLFLIFVRLGAILIQLKNSYAVSNAYNDDHLQQRKDFKEECHELLEGVSLDINQLRSDVEDMKYVSDIFYKYKLPNKSDREFLDQVEIDNEVSEGIARARKENT